MEPVYWFVVVEASFTGIDIVSRLDSVGSLGEAHRLIVGDVDVIGLLNRLVRVEPECCGGSISLPVSTRAVVGGPVCSIGTDGDSSLAFIRVIG